MSPVDDHVALCVVRLGRCRINAAVSGASPGDVLCCVPTMKRTFFFLLAVMLWSVAVAVATEQFMIRRFGLDQGLPQSDVHAITQTADGFIWIATQDGLCRFDGQRLFVYRNFSPVRGQIPANGVFALVRTDKGGLLLLAGDVWLRYRPKWNDFVTSTPPSGFVYQDPTDPRNQSLYISYFTDSRGCKWYGTRNYGAVMVDPRTNRRITFGVDQPPERRLASNEVWTITEDLYGRIWLGMHGGGIAVIDKGRIVQTMRHESDDQRTIPSDVVRTIFRDSSGVMWIGTHAGGLGIWDPRVSQVKMYRWKQTSGGGDDGYVRCFTTNSKGQLYVGTRTGVVVYDKERLNRTAVASWPIERYGAVEALHADRFDNIWVGTQRKGLGLVRSGSKSIRWFDGAEWRLGKRIRTISWIMPLGADTILLASHSVLGVTSIHDPKPQWIPIHPQGADTRGMPAISNIYYLKDTRELIVSSDAGLYRGWLTSGFKKVECTDADAIRPNIDYARAVNRRADTLYVGTWGGGIRKFHIPTWREAVLDSRQGLPSNTVYAVIPRADGSLVASSNAGILFIRPSGRIISAGVEQGAQANEFNTGAWSILDDGTILLGGVAGFNSIQPAFWPNSAPAPTLYISSIHINGEFRALRNWSPSDGLQLGSGPANISIEWGSIATSRPAKVQYRFRLLPNDTSWTYTDVPLLSYVQLPHGRYTLEIESSFNTEDWGARKELSIVIPARFWEEPWYLTVAGCLLVLGLVATTTAVNRRQARKRTEREILLNDERERIARDLHDDVGAGLARIVILTEELTARTQVSSADMGRLSEIARYVIESVRSIVWVIKTTDVSLRTTVLFIRDKADEALSDRGMVLHYDLVSDLPTTPLSILVRRNSILACQEAVTNIVRHSSATQTQMKVRCEPREVVIEFADDGVGLKTIGNYRSNGIDNMRTRMREIGGRFEIRALPQGGTLVTFTIPY